MIEKAIIKLGKKHLFIIGKSYSERRSFIDEVVRQTNYETFRFPIKMKSIDDYMDFVRKKNLFKPWYSKNGKFGINQLIDFHQDWIGDNNSLIVIEEFQDFDENWKVELLNLYLSQIENRGKGQKTIRLIISQEKEDGIMDRLCETVSNSEKERRTKRQIVEGSLYKLELE